MEKNGPPVPVGIDCTSVNHNSNGSITISALTTIRFSSEPQNINNQHMFHHVMSTSQDIRFTGREISLAAMKTTFIISVQCIAGIWWRPSKKHPLNTSLEWDGIQRILMLFRKSTYFKTTTIILL